MKHASFENKCWVVYVRGVGVGGRGGGLEEFYYIALQFSQSTELAVVIISVTRVICL